VSTYVYQVASGSATAAGDLGIIAVGQRNDSLAQINPTNLAYGMYSVDASGRIFVSGAVGVASISAVTAYQANVWGVTASAVTATEVIPGTASADLGKKGDSAWVTGHTGVLALGVRNDNIAARATADGNYAPISVDQNGALILSPNVTLLTQDNADYAEDSAHGSTNVGTFILGVRNDADAGRTNANTDYSPISTDATGRVKVAGNLVSGAYVVGTANGFLGLGVASAVEPVYGASAFWPVSIDLNGYQRVIGPPTTAGTPAAFVVTSATALLATSNPARRSIIITNNGGGVLYIGHTTGVTTASATMGLYVQPSGGAYQDSGMGIYTGSLYGIYSAASTTHNVVVSERS
jgi:hypothetical protein